jgi:hypothetical protein
MAATERTWGPDYKKTNERIENDRAPHHNDKVGKKDLTYT